MSRSADFDGKLPDEILLMSPSKAEGVSEAVEVKHRIFGCEIIQEAGILLKQPQVVMATGQSLFHRFFYRKSLLKFDAFTVAMGCVLLASKVEEKLKVVREILFTFHHIYQKRKLLKCTVFELGGEQYHQWKAELLLIERHLLKELGFALYSGMDHPHKLDLSLRYPASEIACAAIYMACRLSQLELPSEPTSQWWRLMTNRFEVVKDVCESILELYTHEKLSWVEPLSRPKYLSLEVCLKYDEPLPSSAASFNTRLLTTKVVSGDAAGKGANCDVKYAENQSAEGRFYEFTNTDHSDKEYESDDGGKVSPHSSRSTVQHHRHGHARAKVKNSSRNDDGSDKKRFSEKDRDRDSRYVKRSDDIRSDTSSNRSRNDSRSRERQHYRSDVSINDNDTYIRLRSNSRDRSKRRDRDVVRNGRRYDDSPRRVQHRAQSSKLEKGKEGDGDKMDRDHYKRG